MFIHAEICPNSKHLKSSVNIPISNKFIYFISKKVYLRKKERNGNSYLIGHAQACVPRCALQNEPQPNVHKFRNQQYFFLWRAKKFFHVL